MKNLWQKIKNVGHVVLKPLAMLLNIILPQSAPIINSVEPIIEELIKDDKTTESTSSNKKNVA